MSDLYKKMVLALPDSFFDGWEYKNGDSILVNYDGEWHLHNIGEYIIECGEIGTIQGYECEFYSEGDPIRPLPNQNQLQSMAGLSSIDFIEDFYEYSQEPTKQNVDPEQFKTDMECFTLAYVMDRKYKMIWNGEKWL